MEWIWGGPEPAQCFFCGAFQQNPEGWTLTSLPCDDEEPIVLNKCP